MPNVLHDLWLRFWDMFPATTYHGKVSVILAIAVLIAFGLRGFLYRRHVRRNPAQTEMPSAEEIAQWVRTNAAHADWADLERQGQEIAALTRDIEEFQARAAGNPGEFHLVRDVFDRAEPMFERALGLAEEPGLKEVQAVATGSLGLFYQTRGEFDRAEEMLKSALELAKELGHKEYQAVVTGCLGLIYKARGQLDRAESMFKRDLELSEELGSKVGQARAIRNLGVLYHQKGGTARGCEHWARARDLFREIGNPDMVAKNEQWMREAGCPED